jgi:hypothetical protein
MDKKTFIMMRFYDGGGLADYDFITCAEEDLLEHLIKFEENCARQNLGTHIGVLEKEEIENIAKTLKEI